MQQSTAEAPIADPPITEPWQDFEAPSVAGDDPAAGCGDGPARVPPGKAPGDVPGGPSGGLRGAFPARMPDGTRLRLPIRDYGAIGVGGFIANQASFAVVRGLAHWMAEAVRPFRPEVVCGLPTLGHAVAPLVAEALGHRNWVAAGYSRKRWYEERFSAPVSSSTTPGERRIWLDPRVLHRLQGRRVLLVDDVVSTGTSALAGLALLETAGVVPVGFAVAMAQGNRWCAGWAARPARLPHPDAASGPDGSAPVPVAAAFRTPLLRPSEGGWRPDPATLPAVVLPPGGC